MRGILIERNFTQFVVFAEDSILSALSKITANQSRLIFVVSESGILQGVLTDGDFRRWIAGCGEIDLNRPVTAAMNANCRSAAEGTSASDLSALLNSRIIALPLLDSHGRIIAVARRATDGLQIGSHRIGDDAPCFLIAEIGNNHNGDLDTAHVLEQVAMSERSITDDQDIGGLGHDRRSELLGFTDRRLGDALHATGNGSVGRVEDLTAPGIDGCGDHPVGVTDREGEQVERCDPDHRNPQGGGQRQSSGDADAQTGEETRPDVDRDRTDVGELNAGLLGDELNLWRQRLGVTTTPRGVSRRDRSFMAPDRTTDAGRGGLDPEDQHVAPHGTRRRASSASREVQCSPTATNSIRRSSSSSASRIRTSRRSAGSAGRMLLPHSTRVTPSSRSSGMARSSASPNCSMR